MGRRDSVRVGAVAALVALVALAGCHTSVDGSSLLTVAGDRTVAVPLRCAAATGTCAGRMAVRVGDLVGETVDYSVAAGTTAQVVVTLTEDQYAAVGSRTHTPAAAVVDQDRPSDSAPAEQAIALRRAGPATSLVTAGTNGTGGDRASSGPLVSGNGRYVAFTSGARNLGPADTDNANDVYVFDRATGATTLASVRDDGTHAAERADLGSISDDGRYVTFRSTGALAPGHVVGQSTLYLRDRLLGTTTRVPYGATPAPLPGSDAPAVLIGDAAGGIVPGDTNGALDVFVYDPRTGATTLVSATPAGTTGDGASGVATISDDGRYVAFLSWATDLVPGDTNGRGDAFVRDLVSGTTTRVSVASDGSQGTGYAVSDAPAISGNGRFVTFASSSPNLVAGDTNLQEDVFVHDLTTGATTRVSVASGGGQVSSTPTNEYKHADDLAISDDGRYVAFVTSHLAITPDPRPSDTLYVHDRATVTTVRAAVANDGTSPDTWWAADSPSLSDDGSSVVFTSSEEHLADLPSLPQVQVFLRDLR